MAKTNQKNKKMSKGKRVAIVGGAAAIGSIIADVVMIAATPVTGGLSLGAFAAKKSVEIAVAAGVGAAVGGGTGIVVTKVVDSKKTTKKVENAIKETSNTYEAKFAQQAKEFAKQADSWEKEKQEWKHTQEEKDKILNDCLKYIQDIEKERDSLAKENKKLSIEKQELLEKLYGIRTKFSA